MHTPCLLVALLTAGSTLAWAEPPTAAPAMPAAARSPMVARHGARLPLRFEPNRGQADDPRVRFLARGQGYTLLVTPGGAFFSLAAPARSGAAAPAVAGMSFAGANPRAEATGLDPQPGHSNYFLGSASWTGVPHYSRVRLARLYPGIDLIYYGREGTLEYDLEVAPGADPRRIRLRFQGLDRLAVDGRGDLVLSLAGRQIRQRKPVVYQPDQAGGRRTVAGAYRLCGREQVCFELGRYDPRRSLVIDPALAYSTFLGGSGTEYGYAVAVDQGGNAYVAGSTTSANFPNVSPLQSARGGTTDAFVAKLNAAGTALLYATYIGGTKTAASTSAGAVTQAAYGIAVDTSGSAYVAGDTTTSDFPTTPGAYLRTSSVFVSTSAFVLKLNPSGSQLVYSTLLHGDVFATDARGIAVDSQGSAYVVGSTYGGSFPLTAGSIRPFSLNSTDAYVTKLNSGGTGLVYSALLGGATSGTYTDGYGIAVDSSGNAYVTGVTAATDFPLQNPIQSTNKDSPWPGSNAFVCKLNASGTALVYSTYLGGAAVAAGRAIAVDTSGAAYVTGQTLGDFPLQNPIQSTFGGGSHWSGGDAFVAKLSPSGTSLIYSTYLGGSDTDQATGIAVDSTGNAYVTGYTYSLDFPSLNAVQPSRGGNDHTVFKSTDAGAHWSAQYLPQAGVSVTALAISAGPTRAVYAGTLLGRIYRTTDGGASWSRSDSGISGAPVFTLAADPSNASVIYAGTSAGVFRSVDGGTTWSARNQGITNLSINTIAVDPTNSSNLYAAAGAVNQFGISTNGGRIYKSFDAGANWAQVYSNTVAVLSIAVDPGTPSIVYAGTATGDLIRSLDAGADWPPVTGGGNVPIHALAVPAGSQGTVYAAVGVYGGGTFYFCRTTFSGNTVHSDCLGGGGDIGLGIAVHPTLSGTLWVATRYGGVFQSTDGGATFTPASNGLGMTDFNAIVVDPSSPTTLYAGAESSAPDAFLTVLNPSGSGYVYSTYLGGNSMENLRTGITPGFTVEGNSGVAVDSAGNAYVVGDTSSADFPVLAGAPQGAIGGGQDAFVVKISPLCGGVTLSTQSIPFTAAGGPGSVTVTAAAGCAWTVSSDSAWITVTTGTSGNGTGTVSFSVAANLGILSHSGTLTIGGQKVTINQSGGINCSFQVSPLSASFGPYGGSGTVNVTTGPGCIWSATSAVDWASIGTVTTTPPEAGSVSFSVAPNNVSAARSGTLSIAGQTFALSQSGVTAVRFVPVTPCRVADTRTGLFGPWTLSAGQTLSFNPATCGVPSTAAAYSLNVTVVPKGPLGYLTLSPTGQPRPLVSTLNSPSGKIVANAAIVPAGTGGKIDVYVTDATDVILDIDGYFATLDVSAGLAFYPANPCRVLDTRNANGPFGGPALVANSSRTIPITSSACGIPASAQAYSLNATVVPKGPLGYLTLWPAGQNQPLVSTLNSLDGAIVANAAIVPAGANGSISAYVTDATDLVLDINGYFAPPGGSSGLSFYAVAPCRVSDSRNANGTFGGPILEAASVRSYPVTLSPCPLPSSAQAYSLNATVVPSGALGYLTLWPAGGSQPLVSTLNSLGGLIVANAALVPAGTNGAISAYVTDRTHLILDLNGYFAP